MRPRWIAVLLFALSFTCSSLDNITVSQSAQTTIPRATILGELLGDIGFPGFSSFDLSQSQEFQNQGYTKDQIDSVRAKRLLLVVDSPAGGNFDFLETIAFYAEADGLPRVRIAFLDSVPAGMNQIELDIDDVELVDYATAPSIRVTTEATGSAPDDDTTVTGTIDFDVDVDVGGALGC
jgi:hypothetical protein